MTRSLPLALLLGALVGLFSQQIAHAMGPAPSSSPAAIAGMSAECMAMMAASSSPAQKTRKGMSMDCLTAPCCAILIGPGDGPPRTLLRDNARPTAFWPAPVVLHGRKLSPEPEPPTALG